MSKPRRKKKAAPASKSPVGISEVPWFEPDPAHYTTPREKNDRLSDLLQVTWGDLPIVYIRRIEIGMPGWEATYRT